jgi:hypothetical protein
MLTEYPVGYLQASTKASAHSIFFSEGLEWTISSPAPYHGFQTPPLIK